MTPFTAMRQAERRRARDAERPEPPVSLTDQLAALRACRDACPDPEVQRHLCNAIARAEYLIDDWHAWAEEQREDVNAEKRRLGREYEADA